jgi:hypothetical protein
MEKSYRLANLAKARARKNSGKRRYQKAYKARMDENAHSKIVWARRNAGERTWKGFAQRKLGYTSPLTQDQEAEVNRLANLLANSKPPSKEIAELFGISQKRRGRKKKIRRSNANKLKARASILGWLRYLRSNPDRTWPGKTDWPLLSEHLNVPSDVLQKLWNGEQLFSEGLNAMFGEAPPPTPPVVLSPEEKQRNYDDARRRARAKAVIALQPYYERQRREAAERKLRIDAARMRARRARDIKIADQKLVKKAEEYKEKQRKKWSKS